MNDTSSDSVDATGSEFPSRIELVRVHGGLDITCEGVPVTGRICTKVDVGSQASYVLADEVSDLLVRIRSETQRLCSLYVADAFDVSGGTLRFEGRVLATGVPLSAQLWFKRELAKKIASVRFPAYHHTPEMLLASVSKRPKRPIST